MGTNFVPMASPLTNQTQSGSNTGIPPCSTNSVLSGAQPIALSYPTTGRDNAFTPFAQKLLERSGLARLIVLSGLVVLRIGIDLVFREFIATFRADFIGFRLRWRLLRQFTKFCFDAIRIKSFLELGLKSLPSRDLGKLSSPHHSQ